MTLAICLIAGMSVSIYFKLRDMCDALTIIARILEKGAKS